VEENGKDGEDSRGDLSGELPLTYLPLYSLLLSIPYSLSVRGSPRP
jgi:hypothetical protein